MAMATVEPFEGDGAPISLLTVRERHRAAREMIREHPDWADRAIGELCGLDHKTVARVRAQAGGAGAEDRVGRDGRRRPVDPVAVRARIVETLEAHPDASLRAVAQRVQASPETVRDVRERLRRGEDPLPPSLRARVRPAPVPVRRLTPPRVTASWSTDSACSSTPAGASFASWFDGAAIGDCMTYADDVPLSRVYEVIDEARSRAAQWIAFAERLGRRAATEGRTS